MGIEIGNPVLGVEMHRLFEVAHRSLSSTVKRQTTSPSRLRMPAAVPKPR
jgi:hypothetical protein